MLLISASDIALHKLRDPRRTEAYLRRAQSVLPGSRLIRERLEQLQVKAAPRSRPRPALPTAPIEKMPSVEASGSSTGPKKKPPPPPVSGEIMAATAAPPPPPPMSDEVPLAPPPPPMSSEVSIGQAPPIIGGDDDDDDEGESTRPLARGAAAASLRSGPRAVPKPMSLPKPSARSTAGKITGPHKPKKAPVPRSMPMPPPPHDEED